VVRTSNGGTVWTERTFANNIGGVGKVVFVDSIHGWVTAGLWSGQSVILRTNDGGETWQIIPTLPGIVAMSFIDTLQGWLIQGGTETHAYHTTDGGITWQRLGRIYDPMWDDLNQVPYRLWIASMAGRSD